jgi:hypothetical protein
MVLIESSQISKIKSLEFPAFFKVESVLSLPGKKSPIYFSTVAVAVFSKAKKKEKKKENEATWFWFLVVEFESLLSRCFFTCVFCFLVSFCSGR